VTGATATSLSPIFALSAEADRRALIVSVHDVAPATRAMAEKIIAEISHHQIPVSSLLVVPNYHHRVLRWKIEILSAGYTTLETQGHETVIHGYFHERPRRVGENVRDKFLTRLYTSGEGEFYDLTTKNRFVESRRPATNSLRQG
jgi:predicted deacetylase